MIRGSVAKLVDLPPFAFPWPNSIDFPSDSVLFVEFFRPESRPGRADLTSVFRVRRSDRRRNCRSSWRAGHLPDISGTLPARLGFSAGPTGSFGAGRAGPLPQQKISASIASPFWPYLLIPDSVLSDL